ncbi:Smr/MutS family protein [bacterium]|nr:Smr/MutS family protein [bacterium]
MATEFKVKDEVYVTALKKLGVVKRLEKTGKFTVLVGNIEMVCSASELKPREALDKSSLKALKGIAKPKVRTKTSEGQSLRVDLHGMRVEDAMRLVEKSLDRALIDDYSSLELVHGIGTGAIREALHKYLATLNVVAHFRLDDQNAGVTWVHF